VTGARIGPWPRRRSFVLALAVAACSEAGGPPAAPDPSLARSADARVVVCHRSGAAAHPIEIAPAALAAHLAHGDYVSRLVVDPAADQGGDGVHFARVTDAVVAARDTRVGRGETETAACRIVVDVAAGSYTGSFDGGAAPALERFPLIIDVPDITLRGALEMQVDAQGRATGEEQVPGQVTTLVPDRPLVFLPNTEAMIVVVGHPGGSAGHGAVVEGFTFQSGRTDATSGGMGIIALRVRNLTIRGNRFEPGLSSAADLRASSAVVERNHTHRLGVNCAVCLAGPGDYAAEDNRVMDGGLGGIYVSAAIQHMPFALGSAPVTTVEPDVLPDTASVTAVVRNNDIRGHTRLPIGFAVRVLGLGPGSAAIPQSSRVLLTGNTLTGNTFGLILDAGFPQANLLRRGHLDVQLTGNTVGGNCQSDLLVAFTRHTGALGTTSNPYLVGSTFRLDLESDLAWGDAWYAHPDGQGNTLIVDGSVITPGAYVAYDPSRACP